jgi:YfiR/HmsC-like
LSAERESLKITRRVRCDFEDGKAGVRSGRKRCCLRQLSRTTFAGFVVLVAVHALCAQDSASSEYQVKAAFLFHFAQFVEWPAETFKDAGTPLTYCTIGEDPFRGALDQSLSGKAVGARPLRVEHLKQSAEIQSCQVLFIGAGEKRRLGEAMASANGRPVLMVGESEHFAEEGGMIGFCLEGNKIRFDINLQAAEKAHLRISARLLALAKTVIGNP